MQTGQVRRPKKYKNETGKITRRVKQKLAQGDIRGAVRKISSDTGLAPFTEKPADLLKDRHPPAQEAATTQVHEVEVSEDEMLKAIRSFPAG